MLNIQSGLKARRDFISNVFTYASSEQKLLYTKNHPLIFDPLITFALQQNSEQGNKAVVEMILKSKALVIDALASDKEISYCSEKKETTKLIESYTKSCSKISNMMISAQFNMNKSIQNKIEKLLHTRDSIEAEISLVCSVFEEQKDYNNLSIDELSQNIPDSAIFIDIIRYTPFNLLDSIPCANYVGYTLEQNGTIKLVKLGDAFKINSLVFKMRKKLHQSPTEVFSSRVKYSEKQLRETTNQLYKILVAPFKERLKGIKQIFISPDNVLNLIPFEILAQDNNRYLIEDYQISYLSSGREFLKFGNSNTANNLLAVIADPDFDYLNEYNKRMLRDNIDNDTLKFLNPLRSGDILDHGCIAQKFSPLQYTNIESKKLVTFYLEQNDKNRVLEFYKEDATEENLRKLSPPQILHISTHGFFCEESKQNSLTSPLLRSGLVLAGANHTTAESTSLNTRNDGFLTALEVTSLNLIGTDLVTLSACETGVGEVVNGEGVFGLRRAFQIAGAKTILMSLWKVPDKQTSDLMSLFYQNWFGGMSKQKSLREAALELLKNSRDSEGHGHPYLWGGFILAGNPN